MKSIKWIKNALKSGNSAYDYVMSAESISAAEKFHKSFPQYTKTPLVSLKMRSKDLGIGGFYVKDESYRFGLNAFKVLGCSYAMGQIMSKRAGDCEVTYDAIQKVSADEKVTFYTATDGNHGRAVAWTAREFGQKARVYMPAGTVSERFENVRRQGADVTVESVNYDRCVEMARDDCTKTGGVLVQDTAWEGYEEIPILIMQGYGTMAAEAAEDMPAHPTHVFLQAGVGSMAAAIALYFAKSENPPVITVVEPHAANCIFMSAVNGERTAVDGDLNTIMAGLACGEVSTVAWEILRAQTDFFVSVPDEVSKRGIRLLANPTAGDAAVISGESGAACVGFVDAVMKEESLAKLKAELGLDENSHVLCFSTEGATDKENWKKIVEV